MSHFAVMVVTKNGTEKELEKALAPFHEFECTGTDDEFVKNVDQLPEAREHYETATTRRYKSTDGKLHEPYADEFYRDPTPEEVAEIGVMGGTGCSNGLSYTSKDWGDGRGYRAKISFIPAGFVEVTVPQREVRTFAEFIEYEYGRAVVNGDDKPDPKEHKYGWCRIKNGEVVELVDRTNPNAQWDWWTAGGRWSDYLVPKNGTKATPFHGRKRDIDFAAKRAECEAVAAIEWDIVDRAVSAHLKDYKKWDVVRDACGNDYDKARTDYNSQPAVKAFRESKERWLDSLDNYLMPKAAYVAQQGLRGITPFAFLRDGKWAQKGEMGWWACVSNEKENWNAQFADLLGAVPDEHFLTIVDCHI